MYYVLYNKDFNALGARKTYPCSSWSYNQKANEFSELTIEGMAIENDDGAMYVGLHDEYIQLDDMDTYTTGTLKALAFCGIPDTLNGKTKIKAVDIRQVLNNDAIIDLTAVYTVSALYVELLTCLFNSSYGYSNVGITIDPPTVWGVENIPFREDTIERSKAPGNVWETLKAVNSIYDCYVDIDINFVEKRIAFRVKRIFEEISIKLSDFTDTKLKRDTTSTNRVVCYKKGEYSQRAIYYLLNDDTVVLESAAPAAKILYPINVEILEEDNIEDAKVKGIQKLYENRFTAKVEIPLDNKMGFLLSKVDLSYFVNVHEYKRLPVMEVYEDSKGKKKIKLGRLEEYWWA